MLAHELEPVWNPLELAQALRDLLLGRARGARGRRRRGGVLAVVHASERRFGGKRVVCGELDPSPSDLVI